MTYLRPKVNSLINSDNPYLRQHAHNPVDWFEWGDEAFQKAKIEDKPILISIGYSACHWCHVMNHECFESKEISALMNAHLVCIKIDREERPDIDQIYMEAIQAMGLRGGWPLNVFLTPDQYPFYGGTYFTPKQWEKVIVEISNKFKKNRNEVNRVAINLTNHLKENNYLNISNNFDLFGIEDAKKMFQNIETRFDFDFGGLSKSPKFIMPTIWMLMLRYHHLFGNEKALNMVMLTLQQVASGGIYDQIGGGFSRYSVDEKWLVPHFEKMLYDNAQLISLFSEAYRQSQNQDFKMVVYQTAQWLQCEMMNEEGGFYSAIDADSEGEEGRFYTWTLSEVNNLLGKDGHLLVEYFQIFENGNWAGGRNILHRKANSPIDDKKINKLKEILLLARQKRIKPETDDKILLGWNAMLIQAWLDTYQTFADSQFLNLALRNIAFIEKYMITETHCLRVKGRKIEGFLEDYAWLIRSYISFYQCTFDENWLLKANRWMKYVQSSFKDDNDGLYFVNSIHSEQLFTRRKEIFDNVIPSSNAVMVRNMLHLGILTGNELLKNEAIKLLRGLKNLILRDTPNMAYWSILVLETIHSIQEISFVGAEALQHRKEMATKYFPMAIVAGTVKSSNLPMLHGKDETQNSIFVCRNNTCYHPVTTVGELVQLLKEL